MNKKFLFLLSFLSGIFLTSAAFGAEPSQPGVLGHAGNTTSSITWIWTDNSNNEQGFRCYEWYWDSNLKRYVRSNNPVWSVNANITSYTETGLAPNTQYRRVIVAWNTYGESPRAFYDLTRNQYYFYSAGPDYQKPDYLVACYTSIEPPAGLEFGPKGVNELTVRLKDPVPSNLMSSGSVYGYFNPNDSGFWIEDITTGTHNSGWWKDNNDYDLLGPMTGGSLEAINWKKYLNNGPASYNSSTGQYSSNHVWKYWCVENLDPNTPYSFRAKARNGDRDETAWCPPTQEVWTLPNSPLISCDRDFNECYDPGTKFTFTSLNPFGIGSVDHYHIKWTTDPTANPSEEDTKWETGLWIITENRLSDFYLVIKSHNYQHEEPINYTIEGNIDMGLTFLTDTTTGETATDYNYPVRNENIVTIGPFKIGYEVEGKVTISGGTGSYTDVVVHCGGYTTKCDSEGKYKFKNLPPGTYDLYPELPGYRIAWPVDNAGHYSIKVGPAVKDKDFTLAYKNTYTIAGKVTLVGGSGDVKGVTITCGSYTPVNPDANGNFYIPGVFAGTYKLKATFSDTDYTLTFPANGEYTVSVGPDATGKDFVFTYTAGGDVAKISGTVKLIGGSGDPTKATVYCKNLTTNITGTTAPDNTGSYSFKDLPKSNSYELWVKMDGYKTTLPVSGKYRIDDLQTDIQLDFEMTPISYYRISGKVQVSEGVITPPDTKVHCDCLTDTSIAFALNPDNDGTYNFSSVPEGSYRVWLEIPSGYKITNPASIKYEPIVVGPDASGKDFLVEPIAKYSLSGKVTLFGGTCTPREALVVCSYYNSIKKEYITFTTVPDANGNYKFINLVPASYTVSVSLTGYNPVSPVSGYYTVTIVNMDITGKDFYLASYAIKGTVTIATPGPEKITDVTIICSATSKNPDIPNVYVVTHPDSNGNYAFYNLVPSAKLANPAGGNPVPYRVEVKLAGYGCISPASGYYDVTITNKDEIRNFILATYSISGKISLYSGSADLTKATVTAAKLDKQGGNEIDWIVVNPDANGNYKFDRIVPGSYYRVRVKLDGFYSIRPNEQGLNWGYERYIPPSQTNLDFIMVPTTATAPTYTISGRVTVNGGTITPDKVMVHCGDLKTYPNSLGDYYFKNLNLGTYDVWVERLGYKTTNPTTNGGHYYVTVDGSVPEITGKDFTIIPEPVPTYKISGTVTLIGGNGKVTDVTVHCNTLTATPDNQGKYEFKNLPAGSYELWVELEKYETSNPGGSGRQTVKLYDRDIAGVDFTLKAIPTYSISGTVTITDGDVTQVSIICSSGATVHPDIYGRYRIDELLAGNYTVHAEMPGFIVIKPTNNLYSVKLGPNADKCDFTLVKYYTISGRITLSGGTGDVRNVVVKCGTSTLKATPVVYVTATGDKYHRGNCSYLWGSKIEKTLEEAISEGYTPCSVCKPLTIDEGKYEFTYLLPGTYDVSATLDGYAVDNPASGSYKITLGPDANLTNFNFIATTLLSVSGKVTIMNGPGQMSDVSVSIAGLTTKPDANGNYTISGISPGTYDLTAQLTDYTVVAPSAGKHRITFTRSNLTNYNFSLYAYSVSGQVKVIGNADVTNVVISCGGKTTHPDASGNYKIIPLAPGNYEVSATLTNYSTVLPSGDGKYKVTLGPDATNKNFTLATYSISGNVSFYAATGNVTNVVITLNGPVNRTTTPDSKGNYQFTEVPGGVYELTANLPGYTVISPSGGKYNLTLNSNLTGKNFVLTTYSVSGKINLAGSPVPVTNVTVTLTGPTGTINTSPDEKGYYNFSTLPAGEYTVSASLSNHTVVSPSNGSFTFKIPPSGTGKDFSIVAYSISGSVSVYDASGPAGTIVYCQGPTGTQQITVDATGKFKFYPLPRGNYRLWAEKPGYKVTYPSDGEYNFTLDSWATRNFVLKLK